MIFLPWIVFFLGVGWMIYQGFKAKKEYFQRKAEEEKKSATNQQPNLLTRQ